MAHQYGGGDPKVIYYRDFVFGQKDEDHREIQGAACPKIPEALHILHDGERDVIRHEFGALIVMDRVFIVERCGSIHPFTGSIHKIRKDWHVSKRVILDLPYVRKALIQDGESLDPDTRKFFRERMDDLVEDSSNLRYRMEQGYSSPLAKNLCINVGAPVFMITEWGRRTYVIPKTPRLASLGVPAYLDATQLYQELAMFVGNVLNPVEPPSSPMKDIEKVVSHGFDKKVSFRHRK